MADLGQSPTAFIKFVKPIDEDTRHREEEEISAAVSLCDTDLRTS
jgi:hypothetical protein